MKSSDPAELRWYRVLAVVGVILFVAGVVIFAYQALLDSRNPHSYRSGNPKTGRLLQQINCPGMLGKGEATFVTSIIEFSVNAPITITTRIYAPGFVVHGGTEQIVDYSDNAFDVQWWGIQAIDLGTQRITLRANADSDLWNELSCEIVVIDTLGLSASQVMGLSVLIMAVGLFCMYPWARRRFRVRTNKPD